MKAFYSVLQSFLGWNLDYYIGNFVALLPEVEATSNKIWIENNDSARFTDIVGIPQWITKDLEGKIVCAFNIEVDTNFLTSRMWFDKLHKVCEWEATVLIKLNIRSLEMQTWTGFLSFSAKVVYLDRVFIWLHSDFVAKFSSGCPGFCQRISWQVCDNLSLWNNLLLKFNVVLFFDGKRQETYSLYTDAFPWRFSLQIPVCLLERCHDWVKFNFYYHDKKLPRRLYAA